METQVFQLNVTTIGHVRYVWRAGTEVGLIHQVEAGWTTLHTVDVVLEYR